MKRNFKDMWIQLALGQVLSYRLATAVAAKGLAMSAAPGSKVLDACGPPRSERFLNPLEFHGKRSADWALRPQTGQRLALVKS